MVRVDETEAIITRALELGVNFIDTANTYAHGTNEEYIGEAPSPRRAARGRRPRLEGLLQRGTSVEGAIEREIEGTLTRLGVDYLNLYIIHRFDLYIIHRFDYSTPMAETMEALDRLVRDGRARALGASAMYGYQLHNLQRVADENGWTRLSSLQNHYNLLYREDERELIPVVRQYGMSLTPYSPLASGHLTRSTWDSDSVRSTTDGTMRQKYDRDREIDMPIVVLEAFEGRRAVRASR